MHIKDGHKVLHGLYCGLYLAPYTGSVSLGFAGNVGSSCFGYRTTYPTAVFECSCDPKATAAPTTPKPYRGEVDDTWRLLSSSFLVMTCFLVRDDNNLLPKKELHRSLQVL